MKEAVIVAACRTAAGKAPRGALKDTRPEDMGTAVLADLVRRAGDMDPELIDDKATVEGSEAYTDSNGNGLWDYKEPFIDSNNNGTWDAAHVDPNSQPGYTVGWSVFDNTPATSKKYIRVYVTRLDNKRTTMLTCIKARE